ncbi:MAG: M20/M25/M40 family metallo-hydrolase [Bacteroidetes bacterium]|nr:MAG: M20/M25/M40 family metallo-hydrolase [Bacteroidota bacterium]
MRILLLLLTLSFLAPSRAQDSRREELKKLCTEFDGRGYVNNGAWKASAYIAQEFEKAGLKQLPNQGWFQSFSFQVNTFPGHCRVQFGDSLLKPGSDYLMKATSRGIKGSFEVRYIGASDLTNDSAWNALITAKLKRNFLYLDTMTLPDELSQRRYKLLERNHTGSKGIIIRSKRRLIWTVGREQASFTTIEVAEYIGYSSSIDLLIENKLEKKYPIRNVMGMVPGTRQKDSFLVITAHYDHLGRMGNETVFPGANDNASGTLMMLELARYYAKNPLPYTVVFLAFTGEEAGLVGSKYFVENSPVDLKQIRFLMNLDLEGTGEDGATIVNATLFEKEYELLKSLNQSDSLLKVIQRRGEAANSDHYWFTKAGVPSFFMYQMGSYAHYHDPGDNWDILPLSHFDPTMRLVQQFFLKLSE